MTQHDDGTVATFPPPPGDPMFRPRGVLVIDDNAAVRALLEVGLGAHGFAVWLASDGRRGVALYLAHRTAIDIVLLDVRMPGWDGPATLAAIRARDPDVACCFMSADTGEYTEEQLMGLGAAALIQKPFRLRELIGQLERLAAPSETHEECWAGDSG